MLATKAKYFLPLLTTKIYLTALIASLLQAVPLICLGALVVIELVFFVFLIETRPFESTFTQFRLIVISLSFMATNVVLCIYLQLGTNDNYNILYEELTIYMMVGLLGLSTLFMFIEHLLAWRREIWKKIFEPCLKGTRLMGTRNVPVFEMETVSDRMEHSSFKMTSSNFKGMEEEKEEEEMDAFYARMLKK